jgi:hypothetical protein
MSDEPMVEERTVEERAPEDEPELVRALEAADRERAFWERATARFTRRYPEQFVVVIDTGRDAPDGTPEARLAGASPDLAGLEALLQEWRAKGTPAERLWARYVFASGHRMILPRASGRAAR